MDGTAVNYKFLLIAVSLLLWPGVVPAEQKKTDYCSSGWRSVNNHIVRGDGQANISFQCRKDEKPCPPKEELIRRAKLVSKAHALANIRAKIATQVSQEVVIIMDGTARERLTMKAGGIVFQIATCSIEVKGVIQTIAWGQIN